MLQYIVQTKSKYTEHMYTEWQKEEEEISIIPPTNAVVYPWAVMIECLKVSNFVKFYPFEFISVNISKREHTSIQWLQTLQCEQRGGR